MGRGRGVLGRQLRGRWTASGEVEGERYGRVCWEHCPVVEVVMLEGFREERMLGGPRSQSIGVALGGLREW